MSPLSRIALLRALVDPGDYCFDLLARQTAVISPLAGMRIGAPGRHLASQDFFANRLGPGTDIFVSQSRERRGFARAMTFGAILEEERSDVFVECQVSCRLAWRQRPRNERCEAGQGNDYFVRWFHKFHLSLKRLS